MGIETVEKKQKKKRVMPFLILIVMIVGVAIFGINYFSKSLGAIPSDTKIITEDNLQDFIDEQGEEGVEVTIEE